MCQCHDISISDVKCQGKYNHTCKYCDQTTCGDRSCDMVFTKHVTDTSNVLAKHATNIRLES